MYHSFSFRHGFTISDMAKSSNDSVHIKKLRLAFIPFLVNSFVWNWTKSNNTTLPKQQHKCLIHHNLRLVQIACAFYPTSNFTQRKKSVYYHPTSWHIRCTHCQDNEGSSLSVFLTAREVAAGWQDSWPSKIFIGLDTMHASMTD